MANPNLQGTMRNGFAKIAGLIAIVVLIGFCVFMLSADSFEKEKPQIALSSEVWNLKEFFPIALSDNAGVKSYQVSLIEKETKIPLKAQQLETKGADCNQDATLSSQQTSGAKSLCIGIQKPSNLKNDAKFFTLEVSVTDTSKWNLFSGNTTTQQFNVSIDTKKPQLAIVANSYKITQGGSALVIFRAEDEYLESLKVSNGKLDFKVQPFYKDGFYISLIAWSKLDDDFAAKVIARDRAGNVSVVPIGYFQQKKQYKDSTIALTDAFIDGKISALVEEIGAKSLEEFADRVDIFRYINEGVREQTFERVFGVANNFDVESVVEDFSITPFSPLRNGAVMASFGDHRTFTYQDVEVSESNHMGLDLASVKQAPVLLSNEGEVILNEFVGIDGNTVVIYHGLGLSSLYAHLTSSNVNVGDSLQKGDVIANTGSTGLALGDHLHFSVLVQGIEVWNAEWMDAGWIKTNITEIIAEAKAVIDKI